MRETIDESRLELDYYRVYLNLETQFSDMDALGHLNNVAIARMYESARARLHMRIFDNYKGKYATPQEGAVVMVQANLRYLAEGYFPKPVVVATAAAHIGNSSYIFHQGLFQEGKCLGLCDTTFVYVEAGKSQPLSEKKRKGLQSVHITSRST